ncbi:MAG TPA: DUF4058 family protein [Planctomycetaceae bacterium]|nr:DUF4058 family protein [Planctomycetaceae bacterium]
MPSPFPGMDPWLEQHWGDVHTSIVTYCRDRLQMALPRDLRARVEEWVYLEYEEGGNGRHVIPDVRIVEYPRTGPPRQESGGVATLVPTEPIVVIRRDEPIIERFIEIRDFSTGGRLITVIEVLSPTNKQRGRGRDLYVQKRKELEAAHVHLVEIDLLREGERLDPAPREGLPATRDCPYLVTVIRRVEDRSELRCEVYPVSMREPLPVIKVPLRPTDEDVLLDLQAVLNDAYDRGGYDILDYRQPPVLPLSGDDEAWARAVLTERGLL